MAFRSALASHLKNDAGVSAKVGDRIYREIAELGGLTRPFIVLLHEQRGERVRHQSGTSNLRFDFAQVRIYDDDLVNLEATAEACLTALDRLIGTMGSPPNTATVRVFYEGERDGRIPHEEGAGTKLFWIEQFYAVWHRET